MGKKMEKVGMGKKNGKNPKMLGGYKKNDILQYYE